MTEWNIVHLLKCCSYRFALEALAWRENMLDCDASYLSWCPSEKESEVRERITRCVAEHAAGVAAFEERWGELPRTPWNNKIDTRMPDHWTLADPTMKALWPLLFPERFAEKSAGGL